MTQHTELYQMSDEQLAAEIDRQSDAFSLLHSRGLWILARTASKAVERATEEAFLRALERASQDATTGYHASVRADVALPQSERMRRHIEELWKMRARGMVRPEAVPVVRMAAALADALTVEPAEAAVAARRDAIVASLASEVAG